MTSNRSSYLLFTGRTHIYHQASISMQVFIRQWVQ